MLQYPEILGRHVNLMPESARSAEWFQTIPAGIQSRFYLIVQKFSPIVAAEYLRDNHGQKITPLKKTKPKAPPKPVVATIYSNRIAIRFEDGVYVVRPRSNFSGWRFVGFIDLPDRRIIRMSRSLESVESRLTKDRLALVQSGVKVSDIQPPRTFPLRLEIAENVGIRESVG